MYLLDVRCDGVRTSGPKKGGPCNNLLYRCSVDLFGVVETKCPRCNKVREWTFQGAALAVST